MKFISKTYWIGCLLVFLFSCKKEENLDTRPPVGLGGDTTSNTAIDRWIADSLTTPYNIAVKYRWNPWELSLDRTLTPPDESKIIGAMSAVKRVWIDPYNEETGSQLFIKRYSPKQFVLVGSVQYNYNGTVVLGQAEGGNNITFFDINQNFDKDNTSSIKRMIHTSHHEFAHILHQTVMYPQDYKFINRNLGLPGYTATWFNVSESDALSWGYITPYSMASYDEDFVEMISVMLMEGKTRFDEIVASTNATARAALKAKEEIVVSYFRQAWNIDFYSLQRRVQAALYRQVPTPTVAQAYAYNGMFTRASVNPANQTLLPQSAPFMTIYNTAKNGVEALPNFGLVLDSLAVINTTATAAVLRLYIRQNTTTYFADFNYSMTRDANDNFSFTYVSANANGNLIRASVQSLLDYFSNNQFAVTWFADPRVTIYPRVQFTPRTQTGAYFVARLLP